MKQIITPLIIGLACLRGGQVSALPIREVYSQDVQEINIDLKVHAGYGLTIDFIPSGEKIKEVWIADPSHFAFTSNSCIQESTECTHEGASVLFFRRIKPINFPNILTSSDGSTELTVITNSDDGQQKQYQFRLIPASGKPAYTSLVIKPNSEKPLPLLLQNNQRE